MEGAWHGEDGSVCGEGREKRGGCQPQGQTGEWRGIVPRACMSPLCPALTPTPTLTPPQLSPHLTHPCHNTPSLAWPSFLLPCLVLPYLASTIHLLPSRLACSCSYWSLFLYLYLGNIISMSLLDLSDSMHFSLQPPEPVSFTYRLVNLRPFLSTSCSTFPPFLATCLPTVDLFPTLYFPT